MLHGVTTWGGVLYPGRWRVEGGAGGLGGDTRTRTALWFQNNMGVYTLCHL